MKCTLQTNLKNVQIVIIQNLTILVIEMTTNNPRVKFAALQLVTCSQESLKMPSTPVTPSAASMLWVILNGTFSGTRRLFPVHHQTQTHRKDKLC